MDRAAVWVLITQLLMLLPLGLLYWRLSRPGRWPEPAGVINLPRVLEAAFVGAPATCFVSSP